MCQHNKEFDKWWAKQVDNGGTWTTLERLAAKDAWEAATKLVEEKFTSTNTGSPKLPDIGSILNEVFGNDQAQGQGAAYVRQTYDIIVRQLRACA